MSGGACQGLPTSLPKTHGQPLWLLAELTYKCPLQCPYCSNPKDFAGFNDNELSTQEWVRVFEEGRKLGAVQLGFWAESRLFVRI